MYDVALSEALFPAQVDTPYAERTIEEVLREQAAIRPDGMALRELLADGTIDRTWTYGELLRDAERMSRSLAGRHPAGARIAIMGGNIPEWVLVQYGAALAGLVIVTVNPALIAREVRYIIEQSRSEAVYYQSHVRGNPLRPIIDEAVGGLDAVTSIIDMEDHDTLFAGESEGVLRTTRPYDVAMIQYTSGTTGFPKGVMLHQHGLLQSNRDGLARWGGRPGLEFPCSVPLFHTSGSAMSILGALCHGSTVLLVSQFDPAVLVEVIEREQITMAGGVPTMLFAMVEAARAGGRDLTCVDTLFSGGAMVAPELNRAAQQVFGTQVLIIYGQTETYPAITMAWPDDSEADILGTIGQPIPHIEVAILDPQTNAVCALDAQGEICMRGYSQMAGYNDNPEATAATIDADGWLHTGDLGTMDARGYLKITGRVKEMIIRGGENLFPAEIENAMLEHPAVAEVAVVGIPDEKWGETVACFMRCADSGNRPSVQELRSFVRERLSPQKTPAHWIWVSEWPMTGSNKIKKFALSKDFVAGKFEDALA